MKFVTLSLLGLISVASSEKTRKPRVKRVELIANLEALVAKLQAEAASATATIDALKANATASSALLASSSATIATLQANVTTLSSRLSTCNTQLSLSFTGTQVNTTVYSQLVSEYAFDEFDKATPAVYKRIGRVSNNGEARPYEVAGTEIYKTISPEPGFFLPNAGDDTLVRDMQGPIFTFPKTFNEPEDVSFDLPPVPAYSNPSDLYFKSILELAALLRAGTVSCRTLVQAFIDRLADIDPYLGIVATPLYDRALTMADGLDVQLRNGTDLGPLMCIPFGIKDHHQIYDDEPTMYGHILYINNVHKTKSTVTTNLMKYGAIPIAKMMLGTLASGSGNGWGMCMSPYLNGPGGGSSCGSGSGAAYGALPFAVSEETGGSIASPSAANLVSGHISSYGLMSRAGAALLCHEMDHLGFHSRYLSDFGAIMNFLRTGKDPLDGDSVDIPFVDPAKIDVTKLKVLIVGGKGEYVKNAAGTWVWNDGKLNVKMAWKWPQRVEAMKAKLEAKGVSVDVLSMEDSKKLWSFNSTTPYWRCATPLSGQLAGSGAEARFQQFDFALLNSKRKSNSRPNLPTRSYRYLKKCMVEIGKKFLNDPVWAKYDVIIDTPFNAGGNYDQPGSGFEQWVRTSKTFVIDYYEALPCATPQGDTVEGAYATLTALPFEDHKNFAIGAIIQDTSAIIWPNTTAIKKAFTNRERCAYTMMNSRNDMSKTCPNYPNGAGSPPTLTLAGYDGACSNSTQKHLPQEWSAKPYVAPYLMADKAPYEAIWDWATFGPVVCTAVCPFLPSFCAYKNITCSARRLSEEAQHLRPGEFSAETMYSGDKMKNHPLYVNHDDES